MASADYWAETSCKISVSKETHTFNWKILDMDQRERNGIREMRSPSFGQYQSVLGIGFSETDSTGGDELLFRTFIVNEKSTDSFAATLSVRSEESGKILGHIGKMKEEIYHRVRTSCSRTYFLTSQDARRKSQSNSLHDKSFISPDPQNFNSQNIFVIPGR